MGAAAFVVYQLLSKLISSVVVCCGMAIIVAVVVYCVLVVVFRAITYEDCMFLPKGEKIAKILHIR